MATQALQGRKGTLAIMAASSAATTTVLNEVRDYKFTTSVDLVDVTSNDSSGWKESIQGMRTWSLTAGAIYAFNDTEAIALRKSLSSGSVKYIILTPATAKTAKFKGFVNMKSWDVQANENGAWLANFEAEGIRALTYTT